MSKVSWKDSTLDEQVEAVLADFEDNATDKPSKDMPKDVKRQKFLTTDEQVEAVLADFEDNATDKPSKEEPVMNEDVSLSLQKQIEELQKQLKLKDEEITALKAQNDKVSKEISNNHEMMLKIVDIMSESNKEQTELIAEALARVTKEFNEKLSEVITKEQSFVSKAMKATKEASKDIVDRFLSYANESLSVLKKVPDETSKAISNLTGAINRFSSRATTNIANEAASIFNAMKAGVTYPFTKVAQFKDFCKSETGKLKLHISHECTKAKQNVFGAIRGAVNKISTKKDELASSYETMKYNRQVKKMEKAKEDFAKQASKLNGHTESEIAEELATLDSLIVLTKEARIENERTQKELERLIADCEREMIEIESIINGNRAEIISEITSLQSELSETGMVKPFPQEVVSYAKKSDKGIMLLIDNYALSVRGVLSETEKSSKEGDRDNMIEKIESDIAGSRLPANIKDMLNVRDIDFYEAKTNIRTIDLKLKKERQDEER